MAGKLKKKRNKTQKEEKQRFFRDEVETGATKMKSSISATKSQNLLEAIKSCEVSFVTVYDQIKLHSISINERFSFSIFLWILLVDYVYIF